MAINQNHTFEEINGIKCAIVEKNVSKARAEFLKDILEFNRYTVVVIPSPPPKIPAVVSAITTVVASVVENVDAPASPLPETFTVGATDVTFNAINAIFGRSLRTRDGHVVTLSYWQQKDDAPHDEVPYYENKG